MTAARRADSLTLALARATDREQLRERTLRKILAHHLGPGTAATLTVEGAEATIDEDADPERVIVSVAARDPDGTWIYKDYADLHDLLDDYTTALAGDWDHLVAPNPAS